MKGFGALVVVSFLCYAAIWGFAGWVVIKVLEHFGII